MMTFLDVGSCIMRNETFLEIKELNTCHFWKQEQVSASTTTTVLRGLTPDTLYTVTLIPVYAEGDGQRNSENGKTSEFSF